MSLCGHVARVGFLQEPNPWILPEFEIHLPITRIYRDHAGGAMLQQAIGEPAGGSADIETDLILDIDLPVFEGALQFESATADVFQIFAEQADCGFRFHLRAGFFELLVVDQNFPRENESLGAFS